jgi:nicotinate-nucleotide pyrophosphorylase (carboxylating)
VIPNYITKKVLDKIIRDAVHEDLGDGDHSTLAVIPENKSGKALLVAKENGIIAGLTLSKFIYDAFSEDLHVEFFNKEGDSVRKGDIIYEVRGNARAILSSERLVLNFIQRMSGIATYTRRLADLIDGLPVRILDTRKTTPNLRLIEKWAVLIGGGDNHRFGLFDMVMLKDNHIDLAGGIKKAITQAANYLERSGRKMKIEVETRNLSEVREVLSIGKVDIIMLDNMNIEDMRQAVKLINGKFATEASGNVNEHTIKSIAECGVDYISVGALTHSVKSLDLSLLIKL